MATPYKIHLAEYDGPLDLLLELIRKQEMDIHNIPIATITGQYLEHLHKLEQLDMDISADFIYMAATLILIKSKMLLPADPLAGPEEQGDPRAELVNRLVEYEKFKNAAQLLYQKQQIEAHVWTKPDLTLYEGEDVEGELVVSLVDLVRVFQNVLERRKEVVRIELHHDEFTVARMMKVSRDHMVTADQGLELTEFFEDCPSRSAMICSLLAVLELVRLGAVVLVQGELFGGIRIRKHKMFESVFADRDALERADKSFEAVTRQLTDEPEGETADPQDSDAAAAETTEELVAADEAAVETAGLESENAISERDVSAEDERAEIEEAEETEEAEKIEGADETEEMAAVQSEEPDQPKAQAQPEGQDGPIAQSQPSETVFASDDEKIDGQQP